MIAKSRLQISTIARSRERGCLKFDKSFSKITPEKSMLVVNITYPMTGRRYHKSYFGSIGFMHVNGQMHCITVHFAKAAVIVE
jgi:hypothetical protein